MKTPVFWDAMPLSPVEVSAESLASIISADDGGRFQTSVNFYRTTRCYILDVGNRNGKKSVSRITFCFYENDVFRYDPILPATRFYFRGVEGVLERRYQVINSF
jgi:hypothetical protein